jgi:hypothetical protein
MPTFSYTVDGEPYTTAAHVLTPTRILQDASIDPGSHYLVQLDGQHQHSFKDTPNQEIHMHQNMKFLAISTGPTTVS